MIQWFIRFAEFKWIPVPFRENSIEFVYVFGNEIGHTNISVC